MLDNIESYLADWLGRTQWDWTEATLESQPRTITADGEGRSASTSAIFTYEVDGVVYSAIIRQIAGRQSAQMTTGATVPMQYDPRHPATFYYSPACLLAANLITVLTLTLALLMILLLIYHFSQA